jgi:hypothetical protein
MARVDNTGVSSDDGFQGALLMRMFAAVEVLAVLVGLCCAVPRERAVRTRRRLVGLTAAGAAILCIPPGIAAAAQPPPGRGYEQVSPVDKNGVDVQRWLQIGSDGQSVAWTSLGGYADTKAVNVEVPYVGRRTDQGWRTKAFSPSFGEGYRPSTLTSLGSLTFTDDLTSMVVITSAAFDPADIDGFGQIGFTDVYSVASDLSTTWLSHAEDGLTPGAFFSAKPVAASSDGSSVFFSTSDRLTAAVPSTSAGDQLYVSRGNHVEAVGLRADGSVLDGGSWLGAGSSNPNVGGVGTIARLPDSIAVSPDGRTFVYGGFGGGASQVYLARPGQAPLQLSLSQRTGEVGTPSAENALFMTATPDLSKVIFRSASQLTDDAPEGGGDYVYDVASRELSFSNPDDSQGIFSISGLVRVSDDASYVYFVSSVVLDAGATADRRNLYVRHNGQDKFIATLDDSDYGIAMVSTDNSVSNTAYTRAGLSGDGRRLVFESFASLASANTGGKRAVYLYDAGDGSLSCVSCRPDGSQSAGSATLVPFAESYAPTPRAISTDGQTIVFTTDDGLVRADSNNVDDVYESVGGRLHLISGGTSRYGSTAIGMSPDAHNIFFFTRQGLVAEDQDNGLQDVYDARLGGGFPTTTPPAQPCQGDECQGSAGQQTPVTPPASMGLQDLAPRDEDGPAPVTPKFTITGLSAAQRKALAGGRGVTVAIKVNTSGRVTASLTASVGRRKVKVGSGSVTAKGSSTVKVALRLSSRARRQLASSGRLTVALTVSFSKVRGVRTQTFTLSAARAASRKGGTR